MGHVTRHEVKEQFEKLHAQLIPASLSPEEKAILEVPFEKIRLYLDAPGPVCVKLRQFGRIIKHFLTEYKGVAGHAFYYFEYMVGEVDRGRDPTQVIKRARSEVKLEERMKLYKQKLKAAHTQVA